MLEDHAEDVGVVERDRDLQMPPLVWSLVLGFTAGESRSLADFRRSYNAQPPMTHSVRVASING
jgi:putative transposase